MPLREEEAISPKGLEFKWLAIMTVEEKKWTNVKFNGVSIVMCRAFCLAQYTKWII